MFFEAKAQGDGNEEWKAILVQGTNGGSDINETISRQVELEMTGPITMFLINIIRDQSDRRQKTFQADLVYWSGDITMKAFRPRDGFAVIVSESMKAVLDGFSMPRHRYYPVNLINYEKREETWMYYLLHVFGSLFGIADYQASEYKHVDLKTRNIIETQTGGFIDGEAFHRKSSELFKNSIHLDFKSMVLTADYDVLWGFNNSLLVSETAKVAIENKKLKGVQIVPFQRFEIHRQSAS
jgi:hypothetical protein